METRGQIIVPIVLPQAKMGGSTGSTWHWRWWNAPHSRKVELFFLKLFLIGFAGLLWGWPWHPWWPRSAPSPKVQPRGFACIPLTWAASSLLLLFLYFYFYFPLCHFPPPFSPTFCLHADKFLCFTPLKTPPSSRISLLSELCVLSVLQPSLVFFHTLPKTHTVLSVVQKLFSRCKIKRWKLSPFAIPLLLIYWHLISTLNKTAILLPASKG